MVRRIALMSVLSATQAAAAPNPSGYGPAPASELAAGDGYLAVFGIQADPATIAKLRGIKGSRQMAIHRDRAYVTARN